MVAEEYVERAAVPNRPPKKRLSEKIKRNRHKIVFYVGMMAIPIFFGVFFDIYLKLQTFSFMFRDESQQHFGTYYIQWAFKQLFTYKSDTQNALKYFFLIFLVFNCCMFIQVLMSYFFSKKIPCSMFFRILYYAPNLLSGVITTLVFGVMMDTTFGPYAQLLQNLGMTIPLEGLMYSSKTAFGTLMFYEVWISFGVSTLIYTAAITKIPPELFEAGRIDGAGMWSEIIHIVFPMISPILSVGFLQNTTAGFSVYAEILLLTDPTQSGLYTVAYLINEGAKARQYCRAAGLGFVFTLIAIPIITGMRKAFDKFLPDVSA